MATNRALVQDADSITQRAAYLATRADPQNDWHTTYAGQFRAAVLYSKKLVLTDAQVFDGAVLLELGPRGLAEMLGTMHRTLEVVIAMRDESARESLERMLKKHPITRVSGFTSQLDGLGWSRDLIEKRREAWLRAIDAGKFTVSVWPEGFDFVGGLAGRLTESRPTIAPELIADLIVTITRSDALKSIERASLSAEHAAAVTGWWDSAYMDTIALQHGGTWISSITGARHSDDTSRSGRVLRKSSGIPQVVIARIADLSGPAFAVLRSDALSILDQFDRKPSRQNRFRLGVAILEATRSPKPIWELIFTTGRIISWFFVVVFILAPPEDVFRPLAIPLAILGAVLQMPVTDLMTVLRFVFRSQRAFIREPV